MNIGALLVALLIGAIAGFLSGQIVKGRGFGLVGQHRGGNSGGAAVRIPVRKFQPLRGAEFINEIAGGTIGAVILLFLVSLIKKAT